MNNIFSTFSSRKDPSLTAFSADDNKALRDLICTNSATGYVREGFNCTLVPNRSAQAVRDHLVKHGWVEA